MCEQSKNNTEKTYKKISKKQLEFIQVYKNTGCFVASSCRKFGIDRSTFYRWLSECKEFKNKIEDCNEELKDFAESKLWENIKSNDTTAIIFYSKTKMKDRGYVEKQEIEMSGSLGVEIVDDIK